MKNIRILSENLQFLVVKFSIYLNRRVFIMNTWINKELVQDTWNQHFLPFLASSNRSNNIDVKQTKGPW